MTQTEREAAIRALLPLVRTIARRLGRLVHAHDTDDLVGDGSIGLIRAVDNFDHARGTALEAYARKMIVGAMLNGLRRMDPVSERVRRTMRHVEARRYAIAAQIGAFPKDEQLEREVPNYRRSRSVAYAARAFSLDNDTLAVRDALVDSAADASVCAERRARTREIREAIALLPERQRRVVALHYDAELPLRQVGRHLGISPQRVSQLHQSALRRLRVSVPPT